MSQANGSEPVRHPADGSTLARPDWTVLPAALLDKLAEDRAALARARETGDKGGIETALYTLRATSLLHASIPALDQDALCQKLEVLRVISAEDDDAASHAQAMVALAVRRDRRALQHLGQA